MVPNLPDGYESTGMEPAGSQKPDAKAGSQHIYRFGPEGCHQATDAVAVEAPLEIVLQYQTQDGEKQLKSLAVTMRSPGADFDLVRGFLFTEGLIHQAADIVSLRFAANPETENTSGQKVLVHLVAEAAARASQVQARLLMNSACGLCGQTSLDQVEKWSPYLVIPRRPQVPKELLFTLPEKLRQFQQGYRQTGGTHACGLFSASGELLAVQEDVGRHNAMDKLVGQVLRQGLVPLRDHLVLFSGRLSFELVQKARMAGLPFLCALGAPSSLAIELAEESGITLAGFIKTSSFNVYTGCERIIS